MEDAEPDMPHTTTKHKWDEETDVIAIGRAKRFSNFSSLITLDHLKLRANCLAKPNGSGLAQKTRFLILE